MNPKCNLKRKNILFTNIAVEACSWHPRHGALSRPQQFPHPIVSIGPPVQYLWTQPEQSVLGTIFYGVRIFSCVIELFTSFVYNSLTQTTVLCCVIITYRVVFLLNFSSAIFLHSIIIIEFRGTDAVDVVDIWLIFHDVTRISCCQSRLDMLFDIFSFNGKILVPRFFICIFFAGVFALDVSFSVISAIIEFMWRNDERDLHRHQCKVPFTLSVSDRVSIVGKKWDLNIINGTVHTGFLVKSMHANFC